MIATRICVEYLGRWDVDDWLDEVTPQQLDALIDAYTQGAFDFEQWHQTAWLAYMMHIELTKLRCQLGQVEPQPKHFAELRDFFPPGLEHWLGKRKRRDDGVNTFMQKARARYGN